MLQYRPNSVADTLYNPIHVNDWWLSMFVDTFNAIWRHLNPGFGMHLRYGDIEIWIFHLFDQSL